MRRVVSAFFLRRWARISSSGSSRIRIQRRVTTRPCSLTLRRFARPRTALKRCELCSVGLAAVHRIHPNRARLGDKIIVSGEIAVHGIAIMSVREGLEFETEIASDSAALNSLVDAILATTPDVHVFRDPTRGGITSALSEIAQTAAVGIMLDEAHIPIGEEVKGACEILGLDPLYVANEGKLLAVVSAEEVDPALSAMRAHPLGEKAAVIGSVTADHPGFVFMKTRIGGTRVVDMLSGEQLPRIC
jgi:hydrogenase expression/formation protein HypE